MLRMALQVHGLAERTVRFCKMCGTSGTLFARRRSAVSTLESSAPWRYRPQELQSKAANVASKTRN